MSRPALKNAVIRPSYCPKCQRLFRKTPHHYTCTSDSTPLIDVSDPLPKQRGFILPVGFVLTLATVLGVGVTVI